MIIIGRIVVQSDIEYPNSYYYYNEDDGLWYGHIKSKHIVVKRRNPRPHSIQKILSKIATKMGYPKEIFRVRKVSTKETHTHTSKVMDKVTSKPNTTKKKVAKKAPTATFISLF